MSFIVVQQANNKAIVVQKGVPGPQGIQGIAGDQYPSVTHTVTSYAIQSATDLAKLHIFTNGGSVTLPSDAPIDSVVQIASVLMLTVTPTNGESLILAGLSFGAPSQTIGTLGIATYKRGAGTWVSTIETAADITYLTNRANQYGTQLSSTISDFSAAAATAAPVSSVAGRTGAVTLASTDLTDSGATGRALVQSATAAAAKTALSLSSADVGLGNVNNTSDAAKPVSTATQTALNGKMNIAPSSAAGNLVMFAGTNGADTLTSSSNGGVRYTIPNIDVRAEYPVPYDGVLPNFGNRFEFKALATISNANGAPIVTPSLNDSYNTVWTSSPWTDSGGGMPMQVAFSNYYAKLFVRSANYFVTASTPSWAASTAKSVGNTIHATPANRKTLYFQCSTAGTTGSTEPTWPTTVGGTVTDGTVVWTAYAYWGSWSVIPTLNYTYATTNPPNAIIDSSGNITRSLARVVAGPASSSTGTMAVFADTTGQKITSIPAANDLPAYAHQNGNGAIGARQVSIPLPNTVAGSPWTNLAFTSLASSAMYILRVSGMYNAYDDSDSAIYAIMGSYYGTGARVIRLASSRVVNSHRVVASIASGVLTLNVYANTYNSAKLVHLEQCASVSTAQINYTITSSATEPPADNVAEFMATTVAPPATSSSAGIAGQFAYDENYEYQCVATNTWKRVALSTF